MAATLTDMEATLHGDVLTVEAAPHNAFRVEVADEASAKVLRASFPLLDRLLAEKVMAVRERKMEELVDFLTERLVEPSAVELEMARRLARRHARILQEFGYYTAEQLAEANGSRARNRATLVDNWRKRGQVFAVPHPDRAARDRDVYLAFQFDEHHKPLDVVKNVLQAFAGSTFQWSARSIAFWFTSNHGLLPDDARPVDLLRSDPASVIEAARSDARGSAV